MARIWVRDEPGKGPYGTHFMDSVPDLSNEHGRAGFGGGNWNDEIQYVSVESGVWQLFEHINYLGLGSVHLGPGTEGNCTDFGFPMKVASSIKKIGD
jgi:Beta/Gamma crystallin